ncbi:MAG: hypothetical protein JW804_07180 [Sedimentisphaerales bacterium]|nr:hypothetical protein [Sedimentisphaerales bacterium]
MTDFSDRLIENLDSEKQRNNGFRTDDDLFMEQILNNLNKTPLGKVLKKIASMPEVRQNKVLEVRKRLSCDEYELNKRLDIAMERVLEDLTP